MVPGCIYSPTRSYKAVKNSSFTWALNVGRDENVSKMYVDGRRPGGRPVENVSGRHRPVVKAQSGRRRPVEKCQDGRRRPVGKAQDGRRRPVEQLSLVWSELQLLS